jgi:hypothetical protein
LMIMSGLMRRLTSTIEVVGGCGRRRSLVDRRWRRDRRRRHRLRSARHRLRMDRGGRLRRLLAVLGRSPCSGLHVARRRRGHTRCLAGRWHGPVVDLGVGRSFRTEPWRGGCASAWNLVTERVGRGGGLVTSQIPRTKLVDYGTSVSDVLRALGNASAVPGSGAACALALSVGIECLASHLALTINKRWGI